MPNITGKGVKIETTLNLNIIRVHTRLLYLFKHKFSAHHILMEILLDTTTSFATNIIKSLVLILLYMKHNSVCFQDYNL